MLSGNEVEMICKSRLAALFGRTSPRKTPPAGTPEKGHSGAAPALEWQDDYNLTLNGYRFLLSFDTETLEKGSSEPDRFLLGKPRHMVEWAADIAQTERVRNVFEMGILQGAVSSSTTCCSGRTRSSPSIMPPHPYPHLPTTSQEEANRRQSGRITASARMIAWRWRRCCQASFRRGIST